MDVRIKALAALRGGEIGPEKQILWISPPADRSILSLFPGGVQQAISPWKQVHDILGPHMKVRTTLPPEQKFDEVGIFPEKEIASAQRDLAQGLAAARPGVTVWAVAENDAGGRRLVEMAQELGVPADKEGKHHCTLIHMTAPEKPVFVHEIPEFYEPLPGFRATPGVFSAKALDEGSALLMEHLGTSLCGQVGEFGCGWGALVVPLLKDHPGIEKLLACEADARALANCRDNAARLSPDQAEKLDTRWADLTDPAQVPESLDAVIMNPPFHRGAETDAGLGLQFIAAAARALKPGGRLLMVANRHLPYEAALAKGFDEVREIAARAGFKVIAARRAKR